MADLSQGTSDYGSGGSDSWSTQTNLVSPYDAKHPNGLAAAILAIEVALGSKTSLIGALADLATRLNVQMSTTGIVVPIGGIMMYGGASAPAGFLMCDGSAVSRTTYANLFNVISTTYGTGDGSTTFNVPNMCGRVPIGVGTGTGGGSSGTGLPSGGSALTAVSRGTWKGEETHLLTSSESGLPLHAHSYATLGAGASNNVAAGVGVDDTAQNAVTTATAGPNNAAASHNNIQPVMGVNFIIKT